MALYPFILNDQTFQLSDFANLAYATGIPNAIEQLIRHGRRQNWKLSSNAVTIGTGAKSLTGITACNFVVGDVVLCYSSLGVFFAGNITAYNPVTGAMSVNATTSSGAGTTALYVSRVGEKIDLLSTLAILEPLLGGTGAGGALNRATTNPVSQFAGTEGGQNASTFDAMMEIYDDFAAWDADAANTAFNGQMNGWINSPYFYSNFNNGYPRDILSPQLGDKLQGCIWIQRAATSLQSVVMRYGDNGFVLPGGGPINFQTTLLLSATNNGTDVSSFRMGLRGQSSGKSNNIFSSCGCGFEVLFGSSGRYNIFVGNSNGGVMRQMTAVTAGNSNAANFDRLAIYISPDGNRQRFFINDQLVADTIYPMGTERVVDLLHPAYEIQVVTPGGSPANIYLESLWLRKSLTR